MSEDPKDVAERTGRLFLEAVRLDLDDVDSALGRAREALRHGVGGFIIFGGTLADARRLSRELRAAADHPLWIGADLERGAGQQFEGAATLPPPAGLAAHPDPEAATATAAEVTAREARDAGLNWVYAPVLDLDVEAENPIVGTRSFGDDPDLVARLGRIWVERCQELGVAACGKHFPGHGRTTEDSHLEFPVVHAGREALEEDLEPYRRTADVLASVMTAHVGYPALGGDGPATMEPAILRELLREEMGFEGLVISDALVMEGFSGGGTATEGWLAVRALRAGCDLLLYPSDLPQTVRTVRQAVEQDAELRETVAAALARSDRELERFPPGEAGEGEAAQAELSVEARAGELALECIALRGEDPGTRLDRDRPVDLHVLSDDEGAAEAGGFGEIFAGELTERGWGVRRASGDADAGGGGQHLVLLEATPRAWKGRASLSETSVERVRGALAAGDASYLLLFGHPRILDQLEAGGACAWSSEGVMERAAARWLDDAVR
jgi:beta-glucosidase